MLNWKTTLLGVGALLTALGHLATGVAGGDFGSVIPDFTAIATAIGLIFAQDAKAS